MITIGCGGRLYKLEDTIEMSNYAPMEMCQWHVSITPGKHFELTIDTVTLLSGTDKNCSVNALTVKLIMNIYCNNN